MYGEPRLPFHRETFECRRAAANANEVGAAIDHESVIIGNRPLRTVIGNRLAADNRATNATGYHPAQVGFKYEPMG